jgi:hypothetical protein
MGFQPVQKGLKPHGLEAHAATRSGRYFNVGAANAQEQYR